MCKVKINNNYKKFDKTYKTNFVEISEDNEAINYYLKKKDKYPEIVED